MPLSPYISTFTSDLIKAEDPPKTSEAEAAAAFSAAFASFFQNATVAGATMAGTSKIPSAYNALKNLLTTAFKATDPASSAKLMETAFLAYLNAGITTWWSAITATAVASVVPLADILTQALAVPEPDNNVAKAKIANSINTWLTTGAQVSYGSSLTAFFV